MVGLLLIITLVSDGYRRDTKPDIHYRIDPLHMVSEKFIGGKIHKSKSTGKIKMKIFAVYIQQMVAMETLKLGNFRAWDKGGISLRVKAEAGPLTNTNLTRKNAYLL